jgi:hypothetical protein
MNYPYHIQKKLDDNYQVQFTICCCIPLYLFNCGFKLGFYKNDTHFSFPSWCGFYNCKYNIYN